jgi:hypothetical protein
MTEGWLERTARAVDHRLTRRHLLGRAGGAVLAVGPLGALARIDISSADRSPCYPQCKAVVDHQVNLAAAFCWSQLAAGSLAINPLAFLSVTTGFGCPFGMIYGAAHADDRCEQPDCGNPPGSPPPAPPSSPALVIPPYYPDPEKARNEKKKPKPKKKPKGIKKKPPDPKRPCAATCQCGAVTCSKGAYCHPCSAVSGGFICCNYPLKNGKSPCCPT